MNFNLVFSTLIAIALLSGGTSVYLADQASPSEQQISIINTCTDTWKVCVGAIVGLIGGRNIAPWDDGEDSED